MKKLHNYLFIILLGAFFINCKPSPVNLVDVAQPIEKAPIYIPDSPMWHKLASPSNGRIINDVYRTEKEDLFTCHFTRSDTTSDSQIVDNKSFLYFNGNIDKNTIVNGVYLPERDEWALSKTEAVPRYEPIMIGPIAVTIRDIVTYGYFFGSGYTINEDFPNGIKYFKENWMTNDIKIIGVQNPSTLLTGVVANNTGYIIENDNNKNLWDVNNIAIYEKRGAFTGDFNGRFAIASTVKKIKKDEFVYLLSESDNPNIKTKELYRLDTQTFKWSRKADFPGDDRFEGVFFGIQDNLYYGLGQSKTEAKGYRDIWQYNTLTDKWEKFATYPGSGNIKVATCIVAGKAYLGLGYHVGTTAINTEKYIGVSDFWEFIPSKK